MFKGCIIKESINDELILDLVKIEKTEIWKTDDIPKYWTAIFFESNVKDFPEKLSKVLTGNWYVDLKIDNTKIIVFKNKVLKYIIGNSAEKEIVLDYCKKMGIPEKQMDWSE